MDGVSRASFVLDGVPERALPDRVMAVRRLIERVIPLAAYANVDGFSDVTELPEEVCQAMCLLRRHSPEVHRRWRAPKRTHMGIPVNLGELSQRRAFLLFAPYAIHAVLAYNDQTPLVVLHDTSTSIEVVIEPTEKRALEAILPEDSSLRPLL